jgi:hypothetical protein
LVDSAILLLDRPCCLCLFAPPAQVRLAAFKAIEAATLRAEKDMQARLNEAERRHRAAVATDAVKTAAIISRLHTIAQRAEDALNVEQRADNTARERTLRAASLALLAKANAAAAMKQYGLARMATAAKARTHARERRATEQSAMAVARALELSQREGQGVDLTRVAEAEMFRARTVGL